MPESRQTSDDWLCPECERSADAMRTFMLTQFDRIRPATQKHTPHDTDHFGRVEDLIKTLIPQQLWNELTAQERKLLTWSAWTHDVGMHGSLYAKLPSDDGVRSAHVSVSADWVIDNQHHLQLTANEAQVLAEFIQYHSRSNTLEECPATRMCNGAYVRPRLLAAYLRLADALDVTHQRVEAHEYDQFTYLLESVREDIEETIFHWVKSFVVSGICVQHEKQTIEVEFQFPTNPDGNKPNYDLLTRYVLEELQDELQSVEKTLSDGGLSSFHRVHRVKDVGVHVPDKIQWSERLGRVVNYLRLRYSPNSTEMARAAIEALDDLAEWKHVPPAISLDQLEVNLRNHIHKRKCHTSLQRIVHFVSKALRYVRQHRNEMTSVSMQVRNDVSRFATAFRELIRPGGEASSKQSENCWLAMSHILPDNPSGPRTRYDFVLLGCSESVVEVLARKPDDSYICLWVAECRPKSQHGPYNTQTYIDAERYSQMILNTKTASGRSLAHDVVINIIPDAEVATLFDRNERQTFVDPLQDFYLPGIDAVLLGANGVYYGGSPSVAHTTGHLGLVLCANHFQKPIIVVGSSLKVQKDSANGWEKDFRDDKWRWLTSDEALKRRLEYDGTNKRENVHVWNLREERVPCELLTAIVSDQGIIYTSDADSDVSGQLQKWDEATIAKLAEYDPYVEAENRVERRNDSD